MPDVILQPLKWTSKPAVPPGFCGIETVNYHTAEGDRLVADKGFSVSRNLDGTAEHAGGFFNHVHTDETVNRWFYRNTNLYEDDGTSTPSSIASGLTESYRFATYNMSDPAGVSGFFNGTNSEAQIVRRSGAALAAGVHDITQPTLGAPVVTNLDGGTWGSTGNVLVRVCWVDSDGAVTVYSEPSAAQTVTITATTDSVTVSQPGSPPGRATHWRIAFTAIGGSDTPEAFLYHEDVVIGTTSKKYLQLPSVQTDQAFTDINAIYRQAEMPISGVDICTLWKGRLWIASSASGKVAWSERDNPNHWYSDQVFDSSNEGPFDGVIRGLAGIGGTLYVFTTTSIFVIYGDLTRDDDPNDTNATYAIRIGSEPVAQGIGCVSPQSIARIGNSIYFWSTQGPAVIAGGIVRLLMPEDIGPWIDKYADPSYLGRIVGAPDPDLHMMCWMVPRRTNASRAHDGASIAGIADYMIRWDWLHNHWSPPRQLDAVHITEATDAADGSTPSKTYLMATGPYGAFLRMGGAPSGGGATDAATDTDYDGHLNTSSTATSATFTLSGISADDFNGMTMTLRIHDDDSLGGPRLIQKTILDTTVAGSAVTVAWKGSLPTPSATEWTTRIAGLRHVIDIPLDLHAAGVPANRRGVVNGPVEVLLRDQVGAEAIA